MYRYIVARKTRAVFRELDKGNPEPLISSLAPEFEYLFCGDTPLSGRRTTVESIRLWWARLMRLLPGARFDVRDVIVAGPPWSTRVATLVEVSASLPNGVQYRNHFAQVIVMRWGSINRIITIEDTQTLARCMAELAESGVEEATASPISDR